MSWEYIKVALPIRVQFGRKRRIKQIHNKDIGIVETPN